MTDLELDRMVKIAGTDYDRRRKLSTKDVSCIRKAYAAGTSIFTLARRYNVCYNTIKYHVDPAHKETSNKKRLTFAPSFLDSTAQRKSRVAHKRAILANKI